MAIAVRCQCGQRFSVKDELAGKRGKCPKCGTIFRIPHADSSAEQSPSVPSPPVPPPNVQPDGLENLGSLFDEEGIGVSGPTPVAPGQGKPCPGCRKFIPVQSLLCVECGWNFEEGRKLDTKRGPVKRTNDNPYGVSDNYFDEEDDAYTGRSRIYREEPGNRKGPAWETGDTLTSMYFQTVMDILVAPAYAFGNMRLYGGFTPPISFVLVGYVYSYVIASFVSYGMMSMFGVMPCTGEPIPLELIPALGLSMICSMLIGISCGLVFLGLFLPIPMFLSAAILHVCLLIVGGAKRDLEATFRASTYVIGALVLPEMLLFLIPIVGRILASILQWIYTVIAIKHTHEIAWWQAIVAAIFWAAITLAIIIGIAIVITAFLLSQLDFKFSQP